jgi:Tol biopolymer transport system component
MTRRRIVIVIGALAVASLAGLGVLHVLRPVGLPRPLEALAELPDRLWTRFFPPRVAAAARLAGLTGAEQAAARDLAARVAGRVVWSSNRSGNHELYLLELRTQEIRQLTQHPNVDFFSRFSPDGQQVVFLRSQKEWVSFRDTDSWDVMLIRADGRGEERLARGGYHPVFTGDGKAVVFKRGFQVIRLDLQTRQESLVLDSKQAAPAITELGDPELSPDGRQVALYARNVLNGVAVYDLSTRRAVELTRVQACQPTWFPDGRRLAWIEIEGRGGTRVMAGNPDGTGRQELIDLPQRHSHEYFPRVANDGHWLVWGAAAEGHEHDRADYEIFVWRIGTPPESAVRLTHHPGNDQWPDLHVAD